MKKFKVGDRVKIRKTGQKFTKGQKKYGGFITHITKQLSPNCFELADVYGYIFHRYALKHYKIKSKFRVGDEVLVHNSKYFTGLQSKVKQVWFSGYVLEAEPNVLFFDDQLNTVVNKLTPELKEAFKAYKKLICAMLNHGLNNVSIDQIRSFYYDEMHEDCKPFYEKQKALFELAKPLIF